MTLKMNFKTQIRISVFLMVPSFSSCRSLTDSFLALCLYCLTHGYLLLCDKLPWKLAAWNNPRVWSHSCCQESKCCLPRDCHRVQSVPAGALVSSEGSVGEAPPSNSPVVVGLVHRGLPWSLATLASPLGSSHHGSLFSLEWGLQERKKEQGRWESHSFF